MSQDPALSEFVDRARADPSETVLALDVDGSISEIAPSPQQARVRDEVRRTLQRLADRYKLWFISGRDADRLQELVGVQHAGYVGAHGLEVLDERGLRPLFDAHEQRAGVEQVAVAIAAEVPEVEPYIERKRWSVAFHYRAFPAPSEVRLHLRTSIEARLGTGLQLRPGKMVYEVTPAVGLDKGTALAWVLDTHRPSHVLAAGDDLSDVAMFRLLASHRASGGIDSLSVAVLSEEGTPEGLVAAADISVQGVEGLHTLLRALVADS